MKDRVESGVERYSERKIVTFQTKKEKARSGRRKEVVDSGDLTPMEGRIIEGCTTLEQGREEST